VSGEINTASNDNVGGSGVFKQKAAFDFEFRGINTTDVAVMTVTLDGANNEIDLDVKNDTAQWNADKLQGVIIDSTTPSDGDVLKFNFSTSKWEPVAGGIGEANTGSNLGSGGVGVFINKAGVDLRFKNLNAGSTKITIDDDVTGY